MAKKAREGDIRHGDRVLMSLLCTKDMEDGRIVVVIGGQKVLIRQDDVDIRGVEPSGRERPYDD